VRLGREDVFHRFHEAFQAHGLGQQRAAGRHRAFGRFLLCHRAGEEDHGHLPQRGVGLDAPRQLAAVHAGHDDVQQDEVGLELTRRGQRVQGVVLLAHLVAPGHLEVRADHPGQGRLVVNDEDALGVHGQLLSVRRVMVARAPRGSRF
jgi:hypothetical protein